MLSNLRRKRVQRIDIENYEKHGIFWYDDALHCGKHISNLGSQRYSTFRFEMSFEYYRKKTKPIVPYYKVGATTYNLILCPSGSFTRGHEDVEDNKPQEMKIEKSFLLGETEITQELYYAVMNENHSELQGNPKNPVTNVAWFEALTFCNKLSDMSNLERYYTMGKDEIKPNTNAKGFRLPTEWEWEYAAKAGTQLLYSGSNNANEVGWYGGNSKINNKGTTHPVKGKKPNAWGFYDMSGNVREWCENTWIPNKRDILADRVYRGGSSWSDASGLCSAKRGYDSPRLRLGSIGFRVCRYI